MCVGGGGGALSDWYTNKAKQQQQNTRWNLTVVNNSGRIKWAHVGQQGFVRVKKSML